MIKEFCDRCGAEVTGEKSCAIHGIADAASDGGGTHSNSFDIICVACYAAWLAWMLDTKP